tara:strand:+ start:4865 stop:6841 length:1977 start_codon:yes stop_codon:yes gene_type:complete
MYNEEDKYGKFPTSLKSMIDLSVTQKGQITRVWDLCLLYLQGKQNVRYDKNIQQFLALRSQPGRNRLVVNLILNIWKAVVSRLSINYPNVSVLPASGSNEDILKAKATEQALKYFFHKENMKETMEKAFLWLVSCGNVAFHEVYNPDRGCVEVKVVSPYDLFFESGADSFEQSSFVSIRQTVRTDDLVKAYPQHEGAIKAASSQAKDDDPSTISTTSVGTYSTQDPYSYDRVQIFETYWKDGKYSVSVGNTYLFKGENPTGDIIPVQHLRYSEIPMNLWGMGLIEPIIDLQNQYNRIRNQITQNIELMSNPKWLVPKTAGVNASSIRGTPGEIIYYNAGGGVPSQVSMAGLPGYVLDALTRSQGEMMDVSGIHSTTLGKRAVGITSGKAIEALAKQDVSQLTLTQDTIEKASRQMFTVVILLMKKFYSEEKFIRMFDERGKFISRRITQTDIVDTPEIFIEAGSLFRDESQDRDAKVLELLQLGLIDKTVAAKELTFKTGNNYVMDAMRDRNHALEILEGVKEGAQIEVFATDNLPVFAEVFGDFMKGTDYYELDETTRDYIRDVYVSITTYKPNPEGNPAEARTEHKVFPRAAPIQQPMINAAEMVTMGDRGLDQYMDENISAAQTAGQYKRISQGARELTKGPQPSDVDVINRRSP